MTIFPTHTIFREFNYYDVSFKQIFNVDPHSYSVRLSSYYYDRYRSVSMSALGIPDMTLDNDLFGYSPYFYFGNCGLQSLFPITFVLNPHSYIKTRLVLPVKFYRNYFSFINIYTRLQFKRSIFFFGHFSNLAWFIPNRNFSHYVVHSLGIRKKRKKRKIYEIGKFVKTFRRIRGYIYIYFNFKARKYYRFRVFKNMFVSLPVKSNIKLNWKTLFFSRSNKQFTIKNNFVEFNFIFCCSQYLVPNLQRFIKMLLKFEAKMPRYEFDNFYGLSYKFFFINFFKFLKKFIKRFVFRVKNIINFLFKIDYGHDPQIPFFYTQTLTLKTFFFAFVFIFFRVKSKKFNFDLKAYKSSLFLFSLKSLIYSKFKVFIGNFYYLFFDSILKPVRIFKLLLNLKFDFFTQFYDFRYIYYQIIRSYFLYINVYNSHVFISNYKFYFNKLILFTNVFPHLIRVFGFRIAYFFAEVQSIDKSLANRFVRYYFTDPLRTKFFNNKSLLFRFSRFYKLRESIYRIRREPKIFKRFKKRQTRFRKRKIFFYFNFLK